MIWDTVWMIDQAVGMLFKLYLVVAISRWLRWRTEK